MSEALNITPDSELGPVSAEAVKDTFNQFRSALAYQLEQHGQGPETPNINFFEKACHFDYRQKPDNTYLLLGALSLGKIFRLGYGRDKTGYFYRLFINSGGQPNGKWEKEGVIREEETDLNKKWIIEELNEIIAILKPSPSAIGMVFNLVRSRIASVTGSFLS